MADPDQPPYRSLFMRRPDLAGLPAIALPDAHYLRVASDGDAASLSVLLTQAFGEEWDLDMVRRRLLEAESVRAVYVIDNAEGRPVATASARLGLSEYPGSGYLHWVGALPEAAGRGLGYQITLAVLHDFAGRGLTDSVLETDDWRLPAIATYLKCGYVPELRDAVDDERWMAVAGALRPGTLRWPWR